MAHTERPLQVETRTGVSRCMGVPVCAFEGPRNVILTKTDPQAQTVPAGSS